MDNEPDDIDIHLRTSQEVGRRMIALSAVSHVIGHLSSESREGEEDQEDEEDAKEEEDIAGERFDWSIWLRQEGVVAALSANELRLLDYSTPNPNQDVGDEASAGEALGALLWAVGQSELTVLDRGFPYVEFLDLIPSPWDDTSPFLSGLQLRPEPEIASARESAEILTWRSQVEVERRLATDQDEMDIDMAIRDVATEAASLGVATIGSDSDLWIGGQAIRSLSDAVVESMVTASRARLRAINWLCGLGDWDDPTLTDF